MMRSLIGGAIVCVLVVTAASVAHAQTTNGSILGDVVDPSGAFVPGAVVRVTSPESGLTRETLTGAEGGYRLVGLPPSEYEMTVELPGFATIARTGIQLPIQGELKIDFELQVGGAAESITVEGAAPLVQTTRNLMETVVGNRLVRDLPLKNRDFMDLALLAPGVVLDQSSARNSTGTDSISFSAWMSPTRRYGSKASISTTRSSAGAPTFRGAHGRPSARKRFRSSR